MAEVQRNTQSSEMAARFIEFVMMQAQNASLFLGLIPNPSSGQPEVNLDLARLFIDQLAMIQDKTRGNLSSEEAAVLRNALTQLQMAFVEASQGAGGASLGSSAAPSATKDVEAPAKEGTETALEVTMPSTPPEAPAAAAEDQRENKKRFTKSYGS